MTSLAARIPGAAQRRERFGGRALAHHRRRPRRSKAATFDTLLSSRLRRGPNPRDDITWFFARSPTATHQAARPILPRQLSVNFNPVQPALRVSYGQPPEHVQPHWRRAPQDASSDAYVVPVPRVVPVTGGHAAPTPSRPEGYQTGQGLVQGTDCDALRKNSIFFREPVTLCGDFTVYWVVN